MYLDNNNNNNNNNISIIIIIIIIIIKKIINGAERPRLENERGERDEIFFFSLLFFSQIYENRTVGFCRD